MRDVKPDFVAYDYKQITVERENVSMYLDCYENFGWAVDENRSVTDGPSHTTIHLKRDRNIINKAELTRLQRHFEACANEIRTLEHSKSSAATMWALIIGIIGTAFIAGSVFAVTHEPPMILLCILLAIPAFLGWILPYFLYQKLLQKRSQKVEPLIMAKQDEIYEICEKGHSLL
ncbi:MAG: hypothetical protein ACI4XB_09740 [Ruminococcus sp.]